MKDNMDKFDKQNGDPSSEDSSAHKTEIAGVYEPPQLLFVGSLRELLGKSGTNDDGGQLDGRP